MKFYFWLFMLLGVGLEIVGDIFFKKWSLEHRGALLWFGLLVYSIGTLFWALSLRYEPLAKAISIFTVMNLVLGHSGRHIYVQRTDLNHRQTRHIARHRKYHSY